MAEGGFDPELGPDGIGTRSRRQQISIYRELDENMDNLRIDDSGNVVLLPRNPECPLIEDNNVATYNVERECGPEVSPEPRRHRRNPSVQSVNTWYARMCEANSVCKSPERPLIERSFVEGSPGLDLSVSPEVETGRRRGVCFDWAAVDPNRGIAQSLAALDELQRNVEKDIALNELEDTLERSVVIDVQPQELQEIGVDVEEDLNRGLQGDYPWDQTCCETFYHWICRNKKGQPRRGCF